eukprot:gene9683-898_t
MANPQWRAGGWGGCERCDNHNFARRSRCNRCGVERPTGDPCRTRDAPHDTRRQKGGVVLSFGDRKGELCPLQRGEGRERSRSPHSRSASQQRWPRGGAAVAGAAGELGAVALTVGVAAAGSSAAAARAAGAPDGPAAQRAEDAAPAAAAADGAAADAALIADSGAEVERVTLNGTSSRATPQRGAREHPQEDEPRPDEGAMLSLVAMPREGLRHVASALREQTTIPFVSISPDGHTVLRSASWGAASPIDGGIGGGNGGGGRMMQFEVIAFADRERARKTDRNRRKKEHRRARAAA